MKAIVQERFGPPDVLQLADTDLPEVGADDVLVRVHAAALNPYDWHIMRGDPLIARLMGEVGLTSRRPGWPGLTRPDGWRRSARTYAGCGAATRCSASAGGRSPSTRARRQTRWCPSR